MLSDKDYIRHSLETNLFFLRIVKEHAIFAAASLPPRDITVSRQLVALKNTFEKLLARTVILANGIIGKEALSSGEFVTKLTLPAEKQTQALTGIPIDTRITQRELNLTAATQGKQTKQLLKQVSMLNKAAISGTNTAIIFKSNLLKNISTCKAFSYTYPSMLHHIIEESKFYVMLLTKLENKDGIDSIREMIEQEILWNDIMGDHSKFIRGYLDPTEVQLFQKANDFANTFDALQKQVNSLKKEPNRFPAVTKKSLNEVTELRNFKKQGTEGILACKIRSVMLPLLADHVTREANHYLRLLREFSTVHNV
ncbi:DUF2935 domain-containing protein [Clostridium sp. A1-XYC3]|uniref:DUF2935 domain-containing protein n=1 Tax=Clostridium tanneri TaxID=3037988 RepID=A0ABU4JRM2_9CLOT|nr:DUF2935 domain-containing protein [Clostridium sp. A1-XYC3]MDW8800801.1 DUF2935 domain-containing protein [Clostridium sp. A1-XYC3]